MLKEESKRDIWSAFAALKRIEELAPPLVAVARGEESPLSVAQERVWNVLQTDPADPVYNIPLVWRIDGTLDVKALEESIGLVVQRHEILRTAFRLSENGPVQMISRVGRIGISVVGLGTRVGAGHDVLQIVDQEVRRPFDLSKAPLLRATLYVLNENEYLLLLVFHQLVFDGWSKTIFNRDLIAYYESLMSGAPHSLPPISVQFADFACWERSWWQGEIVDQHREFWNQLLSPSYSPLQLPLDKPHPQSLTGSSLKEPLNLPNPLVERIRTLSGQEKTTVFVTLLSGLQVLLYKYTGREDILVFSSFGNRFRREQRQLVGLFANIVPLRGDLSGNPTFRVFLRRIRELMSGVFAHPFLPFEEMMEMLQKSLTEHHVTPFQVMFILQSSPPTPRAVGPVTFTPTHEGDNGKTKFDLVLEMDDARSGLYGELTYNCDLFEASTVRQLLDDYKELLEISVARPDEPIGNLPAPVISSRVGDSRLVRGGQAEISRPVAPRDALEKQLVNLWQSILGVDPVGINDNFFDLGGHSLLAVRLFEKIEKLAGRRLPIVTLFEAPTIKQLADLLRQEGWSPRWTSLVPINPAGSKPPFYCVHGIGGNILEFQHLARYTGPDQPLYGIQAQGLDGTRSPHSTVEEMATHYIKEIRELQPKGPYFLGGSSYGGMVAYEIAQQLIAQGERVGLLALFDTRAPGYPRFLPGTGTFHRRLFQLRFRFELHWSSIKVAAPVQRREYIRDKAWQLKRRIRGETVSKFRRLMMYLHNIFLPRTIRDVQRSGIQADRTYVPKPYPGVLTLFRATQQPYGIYQDRTNGWGNCAVGGMEIRDVPGHHGSIMFDPRVRILAQELTTCLKKSPAVAAMTFQSNE